MRRREFITLVGGAVVAVPLATRAQLAVRVRSLGALMSNSEDDPLARARVAFGRAIAEEH